MKKGVFYIFLTVLAFSCARKGSPSGGPKDVTPPKFLSSNPDTLATHVSTSLKEIRIDFDEYVVIKEAQKQVIISPPMTQNPLITPGSNSPRKYVTIKFEEELLPNTTYNINFGESIADNNEGNKYPFFNYVFSTGATIDSLTLSGSIKNALNPEINYNTVVGLYKNDTAEISLNQKPYYVTKVDSTGNFNFKYLQEGDYKLIAFTDENFNLKYDAEGEKKELLAFKNDKVNPKNTEKYDLVLSENKPAYKFISAKQKSEGMIEVEMIGKPETVSITPISEFFPKEYYIQHKAFSDTATIAFNAKNLQVENSKERISFVLEHSDRKDTIQALYDTKKENVLVVDLKTKELIPNSLVEITTNNRIKDIQKEFISVQKDSIDLDFEIQEADNQRLTLKFPVQFESKYYISFLPNAITDIMEQTNDSLRYKIETKKQSEYGNLQFTVQNAPKKPYFFQLLVNDKVVKNMYGTDSKFDIKFLKPQEYSCRILVDENENGLWDAADFDQNIQPEKTYIYDKTLLIRAFWDIQESWKLSP